MVFRGGVIGGSIEVDRISWVSVVKVGELLFFPVFDLFVDDFLWPEFEEAFLDEVSLAAEVEAVEVVVIDAEVEAVEVVVKDVEVEEAEEVVVKDAEVEGVEVIFKALDEEYAGVVLTAAEVEVPRAGEAEEILAFISFASSFRFRFEGRRTSVSLLNINERKKRFFFLNTYCE